MLRQDEEKQQRVYKQRLLKTFRTDKLDCYYCSSWYHISFETISLSDSKKTEWFQCPLCVDVKSVNKATIGNDLVLDNYVNTAISNVRVLTRVPKDLRVPLAESLSDKINDIVYNVEDVTKWLIFLTSF